MLALYTTPAWSWSLTSSPGCQGFTVCCVYRKLFSSMWLSHWIRCLLSWWIFRSFWTGYWHKSTWCQLDLWFTTPAHLGLAAGHGRNFCCPCGSTNRGHAPLPPSFIGDSYFCDGDYNGALWDGQDCTTACYCLQLSSLLQYKPCYPHLCWHWG